MSQDSGACSGGPDQKVYLRLTARNIVRRSRETKETLRKRAGLTGQGGGVLGPENGPTGVLSVKDKEDHTLWIDGVSVGGCFRCYIVLCIERKRHRKNDRVRGNKSGPGLPRQIEACVRWVY